jgi:hypothetical protein
MSRNTIFVLMYNRHKRLDLTRKQPEFCYITPPGIMVEISEPQSFLTSDVRLITRVSLLNLSCLYFMTTTYISTKDALSSAEEEKYPVIMLTTSHHSHLLITRQILL